MDKFIQYGLIAAKEAIKDSKLEIDSINHDRFGVGSIKWYWRIRIY